MFESCRVRHNKKKGAVDDSPFFFVVANTAESELPHVRQNASRFGRPKGAPQGLTLPPNLEP